MLLIGQFDSPFVRRVGIALRWYGYGFEHRAHAVFRDAELIAAFNPLRRVPTLVLDDGTVLTESFVCLEAIDERATDDHGGDWERLLLPRRGPERLDGLRLCGFAVGAIDKAVTLIYDRLIRESRADVWIDRCTEQLLETLRYLEQERSSRRGAFLLGDSMSHADVVLTCALTLVGEALPDLLAKAELPALRAHTLFFESLPEFRATRQPFVVPTG
jgi:glutathione S-transferase